MMAPNLSPNDALVLSAIFDPEASLSNSYAHEPSPEAAEEPTRDVDSDILQKEQDAIQLMNVPEPDRTDIEFALELLDYVCEHAPWHASGWCNRAQATRLLVSDHSSASSQNPTRKDIIQTAHEHGDLLQRNLSDLGRAIDLATPISPLSPFSEDAQSTTIPSISQAKVLAAAHTHRAYIIWLFSRTDGDFDPDDLPYPLTGLSKHTLEEMASREFALGGKYGHQIAKQVSVKTNPYAKLCGSIVKEAMRKEIEEHYAGFDFSAPRAHV